MWDCGLVLVLVWSVGIVAFDLVALVVVFRWWFWFAVVVGIVLVFGLDYVCLARVWFVRFYNVGWWFALRLLNDFALRLLR